MPLYKTKNNKLLPIKEKKFRSENDIQTLTEENLQEIFGFEFVSTEFSVGGLYIDTLAYNSETNSFIIIEYKKDKSISVIDQGYAYLSLMLKNKSDFILEYNEKKKENLRRGDIDWSQARVYFVSPTFTNYQRNAINFKDLPIELWHVIGYENDIVLYEHIEPDGASESIKKLGKGKDMREVTKEVKEYTEKEVIGKDKKTFDLYEKLKVKIEFIDSDLKTNITKLYVAFQMPDNWRNIFVVKRSWVSKEKGSGMLIELMRSQPKDYKDPEKKLSYSKNSMKFFNQHVTRMYIYKDEDLEYASLILKQAYDRFVKVFYSKE